MFKNLLCFVVLISIILINFTSANSEDKNILPIKKPNLTAEEIDVLNTNFPVGVTAGTRYPERLMGGLGI